MEKNTCWPIYNMWVLDDKITSYNLQIFKVTYLVVHIIEVEKLYHTYVVC